MNACSYTLTPKRLIFKLSITFLALVSSRKSFTVNLTIITFIPNLRKFYSTDRTRIRTLFCLRKNALKAKFMFT